MKNILNSFNSDLLVLFSLLKENKPVTLYYDNYLLFDERPQADLIKILTLAQLGKIQIAIQRNPAIDDPISFWKMVDELQLFLRDVSEALGLEFQTGDITPASPDSKKMILIKLKPKN